MSKLVMLFITSKTKDLDWLKADTPEVSVPPWAGAMISTRPSKMEQSESLVVRQQDFL